MLDRISEIAHSDNYNQEYLSERLANAGLLPMYGFPTLTRELYLKKPDKLPSEVSVSRDIDMALSSFAPGHEIVKDKNNDKCSTFLLDNRVKIYYLHHHYDSAHKSEKVFRNEKSKIKNC